jgi:hypothetical protein
MVEGGCTEGRSDCAVCERSVNGDLLDDEDVIHTMRIRTTRKEIIGSRTG